MKPLILLVHTQAHVDALPETAKTIISAGFDRCWVIISPAIAADAAAASAQIDADIAALESARASAAALHDYEAAASHHLKLQSKMLDRDKAIADAWKSVPEEDRKIAYRSKLGPLFAEFRDKVSAKVNATQEHYAAGQWISMLNSLSGVWPKEFVHGEYVVAWPGAIPASQKNWAEVTKITREASDEAVKKEFEKVVPKPLTRREELEATHHMSLRPIAKALGIDVTGKGTPEIINAILEAESKPAAQPADLATY